MTLLTETWHVMLKQATALKKAGSLEEAIDVLRQAKTFVCAGPKPWPRAEEWVKLPMYLAAAGRDSEALAELQWLLDTVDSRVAMHHPNRLVSVAEADHARAWERVAVYDKLRLIHERAKRPELAVQADAAHSEQLSKIATLRLIVDAEHRARLALPLRRNL